MKNNKKLLIYLVLLIGGLFIGCSSVFAKENKVYIYFEEKDNSYVLYNGEDKKSKKIPSGVSFDKKTNTITLNKVNTKLGLSIDNREKKDITINVIGTNNIGRLYFDMNDNNKNNINITGTGKLIVNKDKKNENAIEVYNFRDTDNFKLNIGKNVNVNLYSNKNALVFSGIKNKKYNPLKQTVNNGITLTKENDYYEDTVKIEGILKYYVKKDTYDYIGEKLDGYYKASKKGSNDLYVVNTKDRFWNGKTNIEGYGVYKIVYYADKDVYVKADESAPFYASKEELEKAGYTYTDEQYDNLMFCDEPGAYELYEDKDGKRYAVYGTWDAWRKEGERYELAVYDMEKVPNSIAYLLTYNDKVDFFKLTPVNEKKYNGYYRFVSSKKIFYKGAPTKTSIKSLTSKKKAFNIKWNKVSNTDGYQIEYSTGKDFKDSKKLIIDNKDATSKTISKLKKKTKYYVRVRVYRIINNKKVYGEWTKKQIVVTK